MECDSVCGLWLTRAGNNDDKNAGRDDNVGVCHIIDQGGALRSALRVLIIAFSIQAPGWPTSQIHHDVKGR